MMKTSDASTKALCPDATHVFPLASGNVRVRVWNQTSDATSAASTSARSLSRPSASTADKVPLIALHGFTGTGADFAPIARSLGASRVWAPDLPWHGGTSALPCADLAVPGGPPDAFDAFLVWLRELYDALAPGCAVDVMGYSMGARLALLALVRASIPIRRAVLVSGTGGLTDERERPARTAWERDVAASFRGADGIGSLLEAWDALPILRGRQRLPHAWRLASQRVRLDHAPLSLADAMVRLGTGLMPSLWDELKQVATPVLVVAGADDVKFVGYARELARSFPYGELVIVEGAGHLVHLEAADHVAWRVRSFLRDGASRSQTE